MTPDQIKMLVESRLPSSINWPDREIVIHHMVNIVNEAIAEEREACAKDIEDFRDKFIASIYRQTMDGLAAYIRECNRPIIPLTDITNGGNEEKHD